MVRLKNIVIFLILILACKLQAQKDTMQLTLEKAVQLANDSSLQAFRSKNLYLASYWGYNNYLAQKKPSVTLNTTPASYNRSITSQYVDSTYRYIPLVTFSSTGNLSVRQNLPFSGGTLYINSDLTRFENIEPKPNLNYNATWFSIGYQQPVFGFNNFKWLKKTEPMKFEIAKKEYVQSQEEINLMVLPVFFNMALAELELDIARNNYVTADTLYKIGQKRYMLASINKGDLLSLKLEWVNSQNSLVRAESQYTDARDALINFLRLDSSKIPKVILPEKLPELKVNSLSVLNLAKENSPFYLNLDYHAYEADKNVERTRIESRFNASLDASIGYNQNGQNLNEAYINPSEKQYLAAKVTVPLVDWGARKSKYYIARNERDALKISNEQKKQEFEQDITRLVNNFNLQKRIIESSKEASLIAKESYEIYMQKFIKGSIDVNTLGLQQNKKDYALKTYVTELQKYWNYYFSIRKLTLYDFEKNMKLEESFEEEILLK